MSNTYGIVALIFGIIGLCCGWALAFLYFIGFIISAIAIIFGAIGIKKDDSNGMAITGLILGIISLVCEIILFSVLAAFIIALLGGFLPMTTYYT
jgi:uncharacterized membrane protein